MFMLELKHACHPQFRAELRYGLLMLGWKGVESVDMSGELSGGCMMMTVKLRLGTQHLLVTRGGAQLGQIYIHHTSELSFHINTSSPR